MSADKQLAAYVDRVLRMKEEADGIAEDIKAIYGEAKAEGYDKTQLGNLVTYLRKRAKDKDGEAEKEAVFDLYLSAYLRAKGEGGTVHATRTHAPDDEITEPQVAPQPASDLTDSETAGQVALIQPETAVRSAEPETASASDGGQELSVSSAPVSAIESEDSASDAGQAPSNLTTFTPKPLRPYCQNPERCGGQGRQHCYSCRVAAEQAGAA